MDSSRGADYGYRMRAAAILALIAPLAAFGGDLLGDNVWDAMTASRQAQRAPAAPAQVQAAPTPPPDRDAAIRRAARRMEQAAADRARRQFINGSVWR